MGGGVHIVIYTYRHITRLGARSESVLSREWKYSDWYVSKSGLPCTNTLFDASVICRTSDFTVSKNARMESWGRILGRNWDNSLKSFGPCYSQSPSPPPPLSGLKLVCNVYNVYGNLKSESSQDYAHKNCTFIDSASGLLQLWHCLLDALISIMMV